MTFWTIVEDFCRHIVAHRAMADVRAMKQIFTSALLARLTLHNKAELHKTWSDKTTIA